MPIRGRKNNLTKPDFFEYFAALRLGLNQKIIDGVIEEFKKAIPKWQELISISFLSQEMKVKYLLLLESRCIRLGL